VNKAPWFHPFTFMTQLPERVRDMEEIKSAYPLFHENLHYLQSVTTFTGIYRFVRFWNVYTFAAKLRAGGKEAFTSEDIIEIKKKWYRAYEEISVFNPEIGALCVDIDAQENIPLGLQYLDLPENGKAFAFIKQLSNKDYRAFFFNLEVIQESMAFAYEIWLEKETPHYQVIIESEDPNVFQYVIGLETVKKITQWEDEIAIAGLTVLLADYALGHFSPSHAFINGARLIATNYPEPKENLPIESMYDEIADLLMVDEVLEGYEDVNQYLNSVHSRSQNSDDPFDRAVGSIVSVMLKALDKRLSDPTFFIRHILTDFGDSDFLKNFHIPLYLNNDEYVDTGVHPDRYEFILFSTILHHRLLNIVDDTADKSCPYIEKTVCGFDKTDICETTPWLRKFEHEKYEEKPKVCLYRFVEHGLQNPAISD